jgi:hypothetical protein
VNPDRAIADRSYRPGDWFGIFGEQATVVLPPSEKARVAQIWALVDEGAGFDEVLDALIADGLRDLPGFVLVSESDGQTKVVIRGPARARFTTGEETVTVEGSSATTWAERSLADVRTVRIDVGDADQDHDLVIRDGLVRISRTDRPAYVAPGEEPASARAGLVQTPQPPPEEPADTPVRVPAGTPVGTSTASPADSPPEDETSLYAGFDAEPDAGRTQAGKGSPSDSARSKPGIHGQPAAPDVLAAPAARLTFSSGEVVLVDRVVVVGRAPELRPFSSVEQPHLVTVPSPHQEISSTHVEIRPGAGADHGSAVVTDLGSTNGTVLQQPGLPPENLRPGVAVQLIPGAIIDLGDGVTIQVGHA